MPASTFAPAPPPMPAAAPSPAHGQGLQLFTEGVDIALQYFNQGTRENLPSLTELARAWAARYHGHRPKLTVANSDFSDVFPHAFNLNIEAGIRLPPDNMAPPAHSPQQLSLEPSETLASDEEMDNVVDLRTRRPHPAEARVKPQMRVNAGMLRCSGLLDRLPQFLEQLAQANTETEAELANKPGGSGFELDDDEAASQPHISMDVFAGLMKPRRRRHPRGLALPADFDSANDGDQSSDAESVGSTSTFNSAAPPPSKKRKAMEDDDRSVSPAISTSSGSSGSSSSSGGPTRIIRIKVPESLRSRSQSRDNSSDASSTGNIMASPKSLSFSASAAARVSPKQPTKGRPSSPKRRPSPRIVLTGRYSPSVSPPADKTAASNAQASDSSEPPQKKIKLVLRSSSRDADRSSKPSSKGL
ncbi:hypothetical protein QBC39DRAFT_89526 [Podospora conica]|nr:hypothetical protein QBC39DRAFT_89526 [Schizothecium conicum]